MVNIVCYRCFGKFPAHRLHFKCLMHKVDDPKLGPNAPYIFPQPKRFLSKPPAHAFCPLDLLKTGFRVCPHCHQDLPYFVGRVRQQIIAITGCSASGKTVYLGVLLHHLREHLAQDPKPFAAAMFEDDESFRIYQRLAIGLYEDKRVPEATQGAVQKEQGKLPPVIVRLTMPSSASGGLCNLIFYDPAGELIDNLEEVRYLSYLAHSAAIIYLVDPPTPDDPDKTDFLAGRAADGLAGIAKHVRQQLNVPGGKQIPLMLAVAVTKADRWMFPEHGVERLVPGSQGQDFWRRWGRAGRKEVDQASGRCEAVLNQHGFKALTALARTNFQWVRYFALSSLGQEPNEEILSHEPQPIGVETPLFWALRSLA